MKDAPDRAIEKDCADGESTGETTEAVAAECGDEAEVEEAVTAEAAARKALFAAVEGGAEGKEQLLSCRPMTRLFFCPNKEASIFGDDKTAKEQREVLLNAIRSHKFHKGYARRLFSGLSGILTKVIEDEEYVPASAFEDDSDEEGSRRRSDSVENPVEGQTVEIEPDEESTEAMRFMRVCALTAEAYLGGIVERRSDKNCRSDACNVIDEVFTVAELLHSALFSLQSCGAEGLQVQMVIASLCETWWHNRFIDKELLVTQLVPLLVVKTLDGSAQKSHIKRLFNIRDSLELLDFEDGSIAYLRSLLLRTVSSPLYLRNVEGRRLIANLFMLDKALVLDLHKAIRVQIPDAKKSILEAYGDVYFRAWRDASEIPEIRTAIEDDALQDLMYALLHVSSRAMSKSIKTVLTPLHDAKKTPEVEKLLHRMYSPILWRALSAANPLVRTNAAAVLCDTFPLKDPDEGQQHAEACVEKTVTCLESLMRDSHSQVRVAGAAAAARILGAFWQAVPSDNIRTILNLLITKHTSDASSPAVRAEAISAVTILLENPCSHAVLRPLLPSVGNLIHDKVEKVRLATVQMLLRIKKVRGIKYYHVVPVDHLLARLEAEGERANSRVGPVASALTNLMLNSYFPQGDQVTGSDQVRRTLSFLTNNPEAASVFYSNVSSHLKTEAVAKLTVMLLKCLTTSIKAERKMNGHRPGSGKKRRRSKDEMDTSRNLNDSREGILFASNTALMASIAETICCLWVAIGPTPSNTNDSACQDFLAKNFSGSVLTDIVAYFEEKANAMRPSIVGDQTVLECHRVSAATLRCASRLPPTAVTGLASLITNQFVALKKKSAEERKGMNLSPQVALLCMWGMQEDVAASLARSISSRFAEGWSDDSADRDTNSSKKKGSNKRKQGKDKILVAEDTLSIPVLPPDCAIRILGSILGGADPSCVAAREIMLASANACSVIEAALEDVTVFAEKLLNRSLAKEMNLKESTVGLVLAACESYGRLALHKAAKTGGSVQISQHAMTLLTWVSDRVVPSVIAKRPSGEFSPLGELNLSHISVESNGMSFESFSPAPSAPPRRRCNRNKTPTRLDASFESIGDNSNRLSLPFVYEGSNTLYVEVAAVSLVKSALLIFSEWVAVGCVSEDISRHAGKWIRILNLRSERISAKEELLPGFLHLATHLAKRNGDCSVLKEIFVACNDLEDKSEEVIFLKNSVSSLLSCRSINTQVVVSAILDSVETLTEESVFGEDVVFEAPLSVQDCLLTSNGGASAALASVLGSGSGSVEMAKEIAKRLEKSKGNPCLGSQAFCVMFLYLLCESAPRGVVAKIKSIVHMIGEPEVRPELERLVKRMAEKVK